MRRRGKFNNRRCRCLSRHVHDSEMEMQYCNRLLAMKRSGSILDFQVQKAFTFIVNGRDVGIHVVDFLVMPRPDGQMDTPMDLPVEVHEVKGFETDVWKLKKELFKALFPNIKYIVIRKGASIWSSQKKKIASPALRKIYKSSRS